MKLWYKILKLKKLVIKNKKVEKIKLKQASFITSFPLIQDKNKG